ncbi:MAG TPA: RNA polymerase factor sigma-54 [Candidatus Omnitrophota bacterium]|nr:RNA polymerase factor sigma-54 [Candidatus Omnitrophota bacterium]
METNNLPNRGTPPALQRTFEQRLEQSQKLILSPQLRQYLKLLQLPLLELRQAVEQELSENPVLEEISLSEKNDVPLSEVSSEETPASGSDPARELEFDRQIEALNKIDEEFKGSGYSNPETSDDEIKESVRNKNFQDTLMTSRPTLQESLLSQLSLLNLNERETEIAREIIGNIDDDGYLRAEPAEIAEKLNAHSEDAERVLNLLQTMDPPGVCARNLRECLMLQLKKASQEHSLAMSIVRDCFELLERKHFADIAKKLGVPADAVSKAFHQISSLEPKPGRIFLSGAPIQVVPDATVSEDENNPGRYKIEIHEESVPRLRISPYYRKMLKARNTDAQTKKFLREKVGSALLLIRGLAQRKSTLLQITEEIVRIQQEFLEKGFSHLKPLRMKDVAETIGIHESTVSRAIAGKYLATPQGTVPYRSFFSVKMETERESPESQKSVMERVKNLVDGENKKKPLSDQEIVKLLHADGIKIARRTVAKYRDLLKILPTYLRKEC